MDTEGAAAVRAISATEARVRFGDLLRRVVEEQTPVVVERGGKPRVVMLSIEEYDRLRAGQAPPEDWRSQLTRTRELIRV